jgi:hypothetical protein
MSGKIVTVYKIVCKDENITDIYIGSTREKLKERVRSHLKSYNNNKNYKVYEFMRKNGSFENFEFKILNEIEYFDNVMQFKQEQAYINCYKPTLNHHNAHLSKEERKEQNAILYLKNKEKVRERGALNYQKNKEKVRERGIKRRADPEKNKRIKEYTALYNAKAENKERIKKVTALHTAKKKVKKNMTKVHDELLKSIFPIP